MASKTIGQMTVDELKQLIVNLMEERRLAYLFGDLEMEEAELLGPDDEPETRTLEEILDSIDRNLWTPPPGSPFPSEMIREDRYGHQQYR